MFFNPCNPLIRVNPRFRQSAHVAPLGLGFLRVSGQGCPSHSRPAINMPPRWGYGNFNNLTKSNTVREIQVDFGKSTYRSPQLFQGLWTGGGTPPLRVSQLLHASGELFSADGHETEFPAWHPAFGAEACVLIFDTEVFGFGVEIVQRQAATAVRCGVRAGAVEV